MKLHCDLCDGIIAEENNYLLLIPNKSLNRDYRYQPDGVACIHCVEALLPNMPIGIRRSLTGGE